MSFPPGFDRKAADAAKHEAMEQLRGHEKGTVSDTDLFGMLHVYEFSWFTRLHEMGDEIRKRGGEEMLA